MAQSQIVKLINLKFEMFSTEIIQIGEPINKIYFYFYSYKFESVQF